MFTCEKCGPRTADEVYYWETAQDWTSFRLVSSEPKEKGVIRFRIKEEYSELGPLENYGFSCRQCGTDVLETDFDEYETESE